MAETVKEKKIREKRTGGGFWGKFIAFLLGFIVGIGAIAGSVAAIVMSLSIKKITTVIDGKENGNVYQTLFGNGTDLGFLAPDYAEKTVYALLGDTINVVQSLSDGATLSSLNTLSPKVGSTVSSLLEKTDKYEIPLDQDVLMSKPLNELGDYVINQIQETPLGNLVKFFNDGKQTNEDIWLAVAYGEEYVDYEYDDTGNIVMKEGKTAATLKDLFADGATDKIFGKLTLEALGIDKDEAIMRSLAYGPASHYVYDKNESEDKKVKMKQMQFTLDGDKILDIDGAEVKGATISANVLTIIDEEDKTTEVYYLKEESGVLYAYLDEKKETEALYPKTKVNDLMGDSEALFNSIYIHDVMNIDVDDHPVLISLAYGTKDVDYKIESNEIVPISEPRTFGYFQEHNEEIINSIALTDILQNPDTNSPIEMYLLYGSKEGIHYTVNVDENGNKTFKAAGQQRIAIKDVNEAYNPYKESLIPASPAVSPISFEDGKYYYTVGETKYLCKLVSEMDDKDNPDKNLTLNIGGENIPYYFLYIEGKDGAEDTPVYYKATTVGDLSNDKTNPLSNFDTRLTVGDLGLDDQAVAENIFLKHVQDETLHTLPTAINSLTITDVYAKEIFVTKTEGIGENQKTYFLDKDGEKIAEVDAELTDEEKEKRVVSGTWWYLLYNEKACHERHCPDGDACKLLDDSDNTACDKTPSCMTACGSTTCNDNHCPLETCQGEDCKKSHFCARPSCTEDYSITDLGHLIANMTNNMQNATLCCLSEDGIVGLTDDTLKREITAKLSVEAGSINVSVAVQNLPLRRDGTTPKKFLQEMTISEMLTYASNMLTAVDNFQKDLESAIKFGT